MTDVSPGHGPASAGDGALGAGWAKGCQPWAGQAAGAGQAGAGHPSGIAPHRPARRSPTPTLANLGEEPAHARPALGW